jgi:putative ABC transport system permease protein
MSPSIVVSNMLHRPMRALATVLAIGLEVALILLVVGLTRGIIADGAKRMEGLGADIILRPPASSYIMLSTPAAMSVKISEVLVKNPGVRYVTPVVTQFNSQKGLDMIYGIDLNSFTQVSGGFIFVSGTGFRGPTDVIVDDVYANSRKLRVGDSVVFLNNSFKISGIVEHGKGSRVFLPIQTMQDLMGATGRASMMLIKCDSKDNVEPVIASLKARLPGYSILPIETFVSQMSSAINNTAALRYFIDFVTFTAALVGFFVIFLAMYTTITERTREIGILKSLGASKSYVLGIFMREAWFLCLLGLLWGIALSYGGELLVKKIFPSLQILFGLDWMVNAAIIAFASSSLGALYPALRAASQDPIDALAYDV